MIRIGRWVFIVTLLLGCSKNKSEKESYNLTLDGVWAKDIAADPLFTINGNSVTGYEQGDRTHFKVSGDTVLIYYEEFIGKYLILKHSSDSLVLRNEDGSITKLYRR